MNPISLPLQLTIPHLASPSAILINKNSQLQGESISSQKLNKLEVLADCQGTPYSVSFLRKYLLIKINYLAQLNCSKWEPLIAALAKLHNRLSEQSASSNYKSGPNQPCLLAQILLTDNIHQHITDQLLEELLETNGIVAATLAEVYCRVKHLLEKSQFVVTMGLVSLHVRNSPFFHLVHSDKNHQGQCTFASIIDSYIKLDQKLNKPNLSMVQDAYSLRCTPQVHGVVYDCMTQIENQLPKSLNKPQGKTVTINGKKMRNLLLRSETQILMLDNLTCAMNEMGHMSFLRSQRNLNQNLTQNEIRKKQYYELLMVRLKKVSQLVARNKLTAAPTNADTIIMDNHSHDIFVDEGTPYNKTMTMIDNVAEIMRLELFVASSVLTDTYKVGELFADSRIQKVYLPLFGSFSSKATHKEVAQQIGQWWAS